MTDLRTLVREELAWFRVELLAEIDRRLQSAPPAFDPEQMMDNHDFMRLMRVSVRTAQKWRTAGLIPYSQIGRKVYYTLGDVAAFIEKHQRKAYSDFRKFQNQRAS